MEDLFDAPLRLILNILRFFYCLAWELGVETIGWIIGWVFYRLITLGYFPVEGWREQDKCSWPKALLIEFTGIGILAGAIYAVTRLL
ncbi:hypothetical protein [Sessilibacter sp. MAH2]